MTTLEINSIFDTSNNTLFRLSRRKEYSVESANNLIPYKIDPHGEAVAIKAEYVVLTFPFFILFLFS